MQTVSEARYTYWHSIVDIATNSGLSKEEWCRKYKIAIKTFNHYEGIFQRQEAKGYVYGGMGQELVNGTQVEAEAKDAAAPEQNIKEDVEQSEIGTNGENRIIRSREKKEPEVKESIYVEIPMPEDEETEQESKTSSVSQEKEDPVIIQIGACRLCIGEGVKEETLRMVLKVVSQDA